MMSNSNHIQLRKFLSTLVILGILLAAYGLYGMYRRHQVTQNPRPVISEEVITKNIETPDETPLGNACAQYNVADALPERIVIPNLGIEGCIERVGLDEKGAVAVPSSIYTAAWYVNSELPGQPGLSIIDGHISGYYKQDGIFQQLHTLQTGDMFAVELGSGKLLEYRVVREQSVPLGEATDALFSRDESITSQLNLITCDGNYNKNTKQYDHRIIVTAEFVKHKQL